jgi:Fe2+ or Zn2+ uptake regulation protein
MSQIKLPQIKLICNPTRTDEETQYNINQPSSLVAYLGITANGKVTKTNSQQIRYILRQVIQRPDLEIRYHLMLVYACHQCLLN